MRLRELPAITVDARRDVLRFHRERQGLGEEVKGTSFTACAKGAGKAQAVSARVETDYVAESSDRGAQEIREPKKQENQET